MTLSEKNSPVIVPLPSAQRATGRRVGGGGAPGGLGLSGSNSSISSTTVDGVNDRAGPPELPTPRANVVVEELNRSVDAYMSVVPSVVLLWVVVIGGRGKNKLAAGSEPGGLGEVMVTLVLRQPSYEVAGVGSLGPVHGPGRTQCGDRDAMTHVRRARIRRGRGEGHEVASPIGKERAGHVVSFLVRRGGHRDLGLIVARRCSAELIANHD
jgi:hypothetical protein